MVGEAFVKVKRPVECGLETVTVQSVVARGADVGESMGRPGTSSGAQVTGKVQG